MATTIIGTVDSVEQVEIDGKAVIRINIRTADGTVEPVFMRPRVCDHDWPTGWNYSQHPAGSKTCRKCGNTIHD